MIPAEDPSTEIPNADRLIEIARLRLAGGTVRSIGAAVGLSKATISRVIRSEAFDRLVSDQRKEALLEGRRKLAAVSGEIIDRLREISRDPEPKYAIRACEILMSYTFPKIGPVGECVLDGHEPSAQPRIDPRSVQ